MKSKILYAIRWQLSTLVLAPVAIIISRYGISNKWVLIAAGNFIGSIVFWQVDKIIFKKSNVYKAK